jgi:hypothetical protein
MKRREMWDLWCEAMRDCRGYDDALRTAHEKLGKAKREAALWQRKTDQANARYDKLKKAHSRQVEMISVLYRATVIANAMPYEPTAEPSSYCLVANVNMLNMRKLAEHAIKMVDIGQGGA